MFLSFILFLLELDPCDPDPCPSGTTCKIARVAGRVHGYYCQHPTTTPETPESTTEPTGIW